MMSGAVCSSNAPPAQPPNKPEGPRKTKYKLVAAAGRMEFGKPRFLIFLGFVPARARKSRGDKAGKLDRENRAAFGSGWFQVYVLRVVCVMATPVGSGTPDQGSSRTAEGVTAPFVTCQYLADAFGRPCNPVSIALHPASHSLATSMPAEPQ